MYMKIYLLSFVAFICTLRAAEFPVKIEIENQTSHAIVFASLEAEGLKQEIEAGSTREVVFDGKETHLEIDDHTVYRFYSEATETPSYPAVFAKKLGDELGWPMGMLIKPSTLKNSKFVVTEGTVRLLHKFIGQAYDVK